MSKFPQYSPLKPEEKDTITAFYIKVIIPDFYLKLSYFKVT